MLASKESGEIYGATKTGLTDIKMNRNLQGWLFSVDHMFLVDLQSN
jgi:hypothetical protein